MFLRAFNFMYTTFFCLDEFGLFFIILITFKLQMQDTPELIHQLQQKNAEALVKVYDQYKGALYGIIFRMCQNKPLAEELLQETFLKIWRKSDQYDASKGKFFTWAYRIAKNTTLNALRRKDDLIQNEDLSVYEDRSAPEPKADYSALKGSIEQLDPQHREAIKLIYFNGLTHREAHEEMGVPLGTFKSYVRQALKKLRETYQQTLSIVGLLIEMMG